MQCRSDALSMRMCFVTDIRKPEEHKVPLSGDACV